MRIAILLGLSVSACTIGCGGPPPQQPDPLAGANEQAAGSSDKQASELMAASMQQQAASEAEVRRQAASTQAAIAQAQKGAEAQMVAAEDRTRQEMAACVASRPTHEKYEAELAAYKEREQRASAWFYAHCKDVDTRHVTVTQVKPGTVVVRAGGDQHTMVCNPSQPPPDIAKINQEEAPAAPADYESCERGKRDGFRVK